MEKPSFPLVTKSVILLVQCMLRADGCALALQYNNVIMIDRIWYGGQTLNSTGITASEYDVQTNTYRNLSSGIQTNSWCSTVSACTVDRKPPCLSVLSSAHHSVPAHTLVMLAQQHHEHSSQSACNFQLP